MGNELPILDVLDALVPAGGIATQITTIDTAFSALASVPGRKRLIIQNTSAVTIGVGANSVTIATAGYLISPGSEFVLPVRDGVVVYCAGAENGAVVRILQLY